MSQRLQRSSSLVRDISQTDSLSLGGVPIEKVESAKLLGVTISANISWDSHIKNIIAACNASLVSVYKAMIQPFMEYACTTWHS